MSHPVPPNMPDADRDAWLSEALRHAPDADLAPPASLSEMILREAQAKARPASPAPRPPLPWWTRLWVWSAKPAVGAGLASVLVASLVGVMMWDRPLQDSSPRSRTDLPAPAPAPAASPPPAPTPQEQTAAAGAAATAPNQVAAQVPAAEKPLAQDKRAVEAVVADALPRKKLETAVDEAKKQQRELLADTERRAQESAKTFAAKAERQRDAALKAEPDALSKAARTAEAMSPAAPAVTAAPKPAAEQLAVVPAPVAPPPPAVVAPVAPAPMPGTAAAPMAAPPAGLARSRVQTKEEKSGASNFVGGQPAVRQEADTQAFVALRAALTAEPAPWTWQRDGGTSHAVDDSLGAFLAQVDAASQSGWTSSAAGVIASGELAADSEHAKADASAAGKPVVRTVRLLRDGKAVHVLRLAGRTLSWERDEADPARHTVRVIQLDERQLQSLRAALDRLTP
jgi:hypothetical protein